MNKSANFFVLALFTLFLAQAAVAQDLSTNKLRTVSFAVPEDWSITYSTQDSETDFISPDGRFVLWGRWWFPDEPLLGFPDIVSHEERQVAGRDALFIHSDSGSERSFVLAFLDRDEVGEQFLLQLFSDSAAVSEPEQRAVFDQLVAGIIYDGVKASSPDASAAPTGTHETATSTGRTAEDWATAIKAKYGDDCFTLDLATWSHPVRAVLDAAKVEIDWVALCSDQTYPVFGVTLPYDPLTSSTDSYFVSLYDNLLTANGNWTFTLVETRDHTSVEVVRKAARQISVAFGELAPALAETTPSETGFAESQAIPDETGPIPGAEDPGLGEWQPEPLVIDGVTDFTALPAVDGEYVMFDGRTIDKNWAKRSDARVDFEEAAYLTADGLTVNLPENAKRGVVGIESAGPMIWLDRLVGGGTQTLSFSIDSGRTNGFLVGLSHDGERISLGLVHTDEGTRLRIFQARNDNASADSAIYDQPAPPVPPKKVSFTIGSGFVEIAADGLETQHIGWTGAHQGNGLDVFAYSEPDAAQFYGHMTLSRIALEVSVPESEAMSGPSDHPFDPPVETLMTPADTSGWVLEPWSYAVPNEAAPCALDASGFSVDNAGTDFTSLGDGCYIRSQDYAYRMERRLEHGDLALFFQFDPARTDNFRIVLTPYTNTGTWGRHGGTCWIRLAAESGAENPKLSLYCGGADRWKRTVQRSWIDALWNGLVVVEQSESRVCVELPGGPGICVSVQPTRNAYIFVLAPDRRDKTPARLDLIGITAQWIPNMRGSPAERWYFLDDNSFDPQAFIDETKAQLLELN